MGGPEMILIFLVILLLFGGKKLPELARGLGKGLREFKDASDGIKREIHNNINAVSDATRLDQMDNTPPSYSADHSAVSPEEDEVNKEEEIKSAVSAEDSKIAHN